VQRIVRETDPAIVDVLKEHFTEDGCWNKDVMSCDFKSWMESCPEDVCVLVGYDESDMVGFMVGWKVYGRDYACIEQAYSVANGDFAKQGMETFVEWAKSIDCNEVRFETEKDSVVQRCLKRYGFTEHSITMQRLI